MVAGERRGEGRLGSNYGFCSAEGKLGANALLDLSVELFGVLVDTLRCGRNAVEKRETLIHAGQIVSRQPTPGTSLLYFSEVPNQEETHLVFSTRSNKDRRLQNRRL